MIPGVGPLLAPIAKAGMSAAGISTTGEKSSLFASGDPHNPLGLGQGGLDILHGAITGFGETPGTPGGPGAAPGGQIMSMISQFAGSFDVGTDYVPRTGMAMVHKGERITPAAFNPAIKDSAMNDNSGIHNRLDQLIGVMSKPQRSYVTTGDFYSGSALGQGQLSDISL